MRIGVIDVKGTGCKSMLLMVLSVFRDLNLEPLIVPTNNNSTSIYHYMIEARDLYYLSNNDAKVICMIRDPRSVVVAGGDFDDYLQSLLIAQDRANDFDIMMVRYEELLKDPGLMQDAVCNWLGYNAVYTKHFKDIACDYGEIDILFTDNMAVFDVCQSELTLSGMGVQLWKEDRQKLSEQIKVYPEIVEWVRILGYEENDNWVLEL